MKSLHISKTKNKNKAVTIRRSDGSATAKDEEGAIVCMQALCNVFNLVMNAYIKKEAAATTRDSDDNATK